MYCIRVVVKLNGVLQVMYGPPPFAEFMTLRPCRMQLLVEEALEAQGKEIRGGDTEIGEVQGEAITYNDYFNDSSDEGSYVESEGNHTNVCKIFQS